jgi:TusA-related sulfurtransferase
MSVREVGERFLGAVAARDFDAVRSVLADDVCLRMLVPRGFMTSDGANEVVGRFEGWFGEAGPWELESSSVAEVVGRVAVTYRLRLGKLGSPHLIEQHLVLDVDADGRVVRIDLLCSGFRPIVATDADVVHHFDAGDLGCADGLAAAFRRQVTSIPVGDVLVVTTRDPAAREDLPSLARLMGQVVRSREASDDGRLVITVERGR